MNKTNHTSINPLGKRNLVKSHSEISRECIDIDVVGPIIMRRRKIGVATGLAIEVRALLLGQTVFELGASLTKLKASLLALLLFVGVQISRLSIHHHCPRCGGKALLDSGLFEKRPCLQNFVDKLVISPQRCIPGLSQGLNLCAVLGMARAKQRLLGSVLAVLSG